MNDAQEPASSIIGILGGMGPAAGLELAAHVLEETRAESDQDHVPVVLFSMPGGVVNRTDFLLGSTDVNPGIEIARQAGHMARVGVSVAAVACNTAHAPPIFDEAMRRIRESGLPMRVLHLIDETVSFVRTEYPDVRRVGILGTMGTYRFRLYDDRLIPAGLQPVLPDDEIASGSLQGCIFDRDWGIKAKSRPVSERARRCVREAAEHLVAKGAEAIILGCTELPLALPGRHISGAALIDPSRIMARALIAHAFPERLRPLAAD